MNVIAHLSLVRLVVAAALAVPLALLAIPALHTDDAEAASGYDAVVLADRPAGFWPLAGTARDVSGGGHHGSVRGTAPGRGTLPNGSTASVFDGRSTYVRIPDAPRFSISRTRRLTWEAWLRPATLQQARALNGYVDFLGKCAEYSPSCEWEGRMYQQSGVSGRSSRISAYVFNRTAGLGSAADWQPASGVIRAGRWLHVVAEYQTASTPSGCSSAYPGSIAIWVNGVKWSFAHHRPTGCMSQYRVRPAAGTSPVLIGTMARDSWFGGAIAKVAIYDRLLTSAEIAEHYTAMTGRAPTGRCAATCTLG